MRKAIFRAWHETNKAFEYYSLFDFFENGWRVCEAMKPYNKLEHNPLNPMFVTEDELRKVFDKSFTGTAKWQFSTGITDMEGENIWEDDIVYYRGEIGKVIYCDAAYEINCGHGKYIARLCMVHSLELKVIGNCSQDPQLLKCNESHT